MKNEYEYYSTSDLALASTLSLWYPIEALERVESGKVNFLFKRDEQLDQLLESYWRKALRVEPQSYFSQLKLLKSRLYSDK